MLTGAMVMHGTFISWHTAVIAIELGVLPRTSSHRHQGVAGYRPNERTLVLSAPFITRTVSARIFYPVSECALGSQARDGAGGGMNIEVDHDELEYLIEGLKDQLDYYCDKEDQEERDAINRLLGRLRAAEMASRANRPCPAPSEADRKAAQRSFEEGDG
jgi:hypothetical protein